LRAFSRLIRPACVAAVLLWPGAVGAEPLSQALQNLIDTHPEVRAALKRKQAAGEGIRRAFADQLPQADLTGDSGYEYIDSPSRRADPGDASSLPRYKATLSVTQNVFSGFRNESNVQIAELSRDVSDLQLSNTRQALLLEGVSAYLDVIRQAALVDLAVQNEQTIRTQLQLEDERVQRGSGATVDVLLAKSRLQRARELRVSFAGALKPAIAGYRELFAVPPEVGSMETPPVPEELLPSSLDDALATAATDNLVLRTRRVQVDVADRQRTVAASPYYPRVGIVGSANWEKNIDAERGIRRDYTILLQSTWQFFTGFRTQADVAAASLNSAASRDDVDNAVRDVRQQVKDSWEELQTARERVELLRNAVSISEEVFRGALAAARGRPRDGDQRAGRRDRDLQRAHQPGQRRIRRTAFQLPPAVRHGPPDAGAALPRRRRSGR